jgi:hypothetical protein
MRKSEIKKPTDFFVKQIPSTLKSVEGDALTWVIYEKHIITTGFKGLLNKIFGWLGKFYELGKHEVHSELGVITQRAHATEAEAYAYLGGLYQHWQSVENVIKSL